MQSHMVLMVHCSAKKNNTSLNVVVFVYTNVFRLNSCIKPVLSHEGNSYVSLLGIFNVLVKCMSTSQHRLPPK